VTAHVRKGNYAARFEEMG